MMTEAQKLNCFGTADPDGFVDSLKESLQYRLSGKDMIIMSLLSDVQEAMESGYDKEYVRKRINLIKYAISELEEK